MPNRKLNKLFFEEKKKDIDTSNIRVCLRDMYIAYSNAYCFTKKARWYIWILVQCANRASNWVFFLVNRKVFFLLETVKKDRRPSSPGPFHHLDKTRFFFTLVDKSEREARRTCLDNAAVLCRVCRIYSILIKSRCKTFLC